MELALNLLEGKYKLNILCHFSEQQVLRFNEFKKRLKSISHKVRTSQLWELERDRLISRVVYPSVPPKVEYSLTEHGQQLMPIFSELHKWGQYYMNNVQDGPDQRMC